MAVAVHHGPFGRASIYRLDRPLATHAHRESHVAFYMRGAVPDVTVSRTTLALTSRTALAVNPWQPHSFEPGERGGATDVLLLYIKPIWFLQAGCAARAPLHFGRCEIEVTPSISQMVAHIAARLMDDDPSDCFDQLIYELTRDCFEQSWQAELSEEEPITRHGSRDFRVRNSIRLMQQRVGADVELDAIARDSGLSRPHFYKLFKRHLGITPNIYLNTLRMELAIERLTRSAVAVTSIGLDLGFASQASFTRFFTANVGIPPTDYRRAACLTDEAIVH